MRKHISELTIVSQRHNPRLVWHGRTNRTSRAVCFQSVFQEWPSVSRCPRSKDLSTFGFLLYSSLSVGIISCHLLGRKSFGNTFWFLSRQKDFLGRVFRLKQWYPLSCLCTGVHTVTLTWRHPKRHGDERSLAEIFFRTATEWDRATTHSRQDRTIPSAPVCASSPTGVKNISLCVIQCSECVVK